MIGMIIPFPRQHDDRAALNPLGAIAVSPARTCATPAGCEDPATITSANTMDPPYNRYSKEFATYQDFLRVVPASMRSLPCYITEANYGTDIPEGQDRWEDRNTGWIRRAYEDINGWNQNPGDQVIRARVLDRCASYDRFAI